MHSVSSHPDWSVNSQERVGNVDEAEGSPPLLGQQVPVSERMQLPENWDLRLAIVQSLYNPVTIPRLWFSS